MKTIYVALVVDQNGSPLSPERQMAVALSRMFTRKTRITSASLIGWPLLLVRNEDSGGYLIFDETNQLDTIFNRIVPGDYERYIDSLSKVNNPNDFLDLIRKIPWGDPRGKESVKLKGLIGEDVSDLLKNPSVALPLQVLEKKINEDMAFLEVEEWKRLQNDITVEIGKLDEYVNSFSAIAEMFIGKMAEERRRVESLYDDEIEKVKQEMEQLLKQKKPVAYDEVKKKVMDFSPKLSEIYGVIAKTRLDLEGGSISQRQISSLESAKDKLLKDLDDQINQLLEPFRAEIRTLKAKIDALETKKKQELSKVDEKLETLRKASDEVKSSLAGIKEIKRKELEELASFSRRTIYIDDRVEVVIPFLAVRDEYGFTQVLSSLVYNGRNKSMFGFGTKLENMATPIIEDKINYFRIPMGNLQDNVRGRRQEIETGIAWLENEGWKVRKLFEDYYF